MGINVSQSSVALLEGDVQIGAAEIKDADSAARANVKAANTARTTATVVLATQGVDEAGGVLKTSALALEAGGNLAAIAASVGIGASMTSVPVNVAAGAATELIAAPAAGHQLWIYGYELHANVQGTIQLLDDTPTAKTGTMPVGAGGGMARDGAYPIFKCATAKALDITAVTCDVDGIITYRDVTL